MPKRIRTRRGNRKPRQMGSRASNFNMFNTTVTALPLAIKAVGLNQFPIPSLVLCPDLVAGQNRPIRIMSVMARFYPVPTPTTAPVLVSAQLSFTDLATKQMVPTTPIIPLSATFPMKLFGRAIMPRYMASGDNSNSIFQINLSSSIVAATVFVDLQTRWHLSYDNLTSPPAPLLPTFSDPELEDLDLTEIVPSKPQSQRRLKY